MKFSINDFFSKFEQIRKKLRICLHLLKKPFVENFNFCAVWIGLSVLIFQILVNKREYTCKIKILIRFLCIQKQSRLEMFCNRSVHKKLVKLTGKYLCWNLFFNKVAETPAHYEFWEIFKSTSFIEHIQWLFLCILCSVLEFPWKNSFARN